ncbi:uncharacterized protein [Ptychodera flava]|uniref:uncharacterized protein n=1 Tax=Ptychodera flava TaxID=63121 RepID=UPI00396A1D1F
MRGFTPVAVNLLIAFILAMCSPDEAVAEYNPHLQTTIRGVCMTARHLTNGIQHVVDGFSEVKNKAFSVDSVEYLKIAFDSLSTDKTSSTGWLNLDRFFETLRGPTVAYTTFGVGVLYLVDELCLSFEIKQSFERHSHLKLRFDKIRNAFYKEQTLIQEFASRLRSDSPFVRKASDFEILKNVQTLVAEIKDLLHDVNREVSRVEFQKRKAGEQRIFSRNIGAVSGFLLVTGVMTGGVSLVSGPGIALAGGLVGGVTGTHISSINEQASGKLLIELNKLAWQAEKLYEDIDKVHVFFHRHMSHTPPLSRRHPSVNPSTLIP